MNEKMQLAVYGEAVTFWKKLMVIIFNNICGQNNETTDWLKKK